MSVEVVDMKPTRRAPCTIRCPYGVALMYGSSTWLGCRSPVIPANRYTSDSPSVFLNCTRWLSVPDSPRPLPSATASPPLLRRPLGVPEAGCPLFQKGGDPFQHVVGLEDAMALLEGEPDGGVPIRLGGHAHQPFAG